MIELRWKERMVYDHFDPKIGRRVTALQYRQREYRTADNDIAQVGPWSDWTDVPTVGSAEE